MAKYENHISSHSYAFGAFFAHNLSGAPMLSLKTGACLKREYFTRTCIQRNRVNGEALLVACYYFGIEIEYSIII